MKQRTCADPPILTGALLLFLSLPTALADAQTVPGDRLDPGYVRPETPPPAPPSVDRSMVEVAPVTRASVPISGIQFKGVDVPANVAAASEAFLGRPADTATLTELAAAMTAAYKQSDVALFTLAIPQQDFADGIVKVYIAEGYVARVLTLRGTQEIKAPLIEGYVAPILAEKPATRETLERGLTLARRAEGTKVTPQLKTVPLPGAVAIVLDVEEKKNGFAVGFDSRQSELVDSGRLSASAFGYGLLRGGDALRGRISATPDGEQSRSASLEYSTPIGFDGLTASLGGALQQTNPDALNLQGDATFFSAELAYPLLLDFRRELSVSAAIDRIESTNTALGSILANERIAAIRLGSRYSWSGTGRSASLGARFSQGLDVDAPNTSVPGASTSFSKLNLTASGVQTVTRRGVLRLRGTLQFANASLPANERLLLGGAEFGRGFENARLSFDRGYAVSIEPAWRPLESGNFAKSEIYIFADYGDGTLAPDSLLERGYDFGSAGLGTRLTYKDLGTVGLEYAEPWSTPDIIVSDEGIFTLSWAFRYQQ